jgi:hypothetical protein
VAKDILFDPNQGYVYIHFSLRRWLWSHVLGLSIWISDLGNWLFNIAHERSGEETLFILNGEYPDDVIDDALRAEAEERVIFLLPAPTEVSRG